MQNKLIKYLSGFVTPARLKLFEEVLNKRTSYITVVLEDIYQPQNASAVLRTCDCFGIQNVHVIENRNSFRVSSQVSLGASKWLTIHKYNKDADNTPEAVRSLKQNGYRIVATTPGKECGLLKDFDISKGKTAIVFGSELPGISEYLLNNADEFLKIPMVGFTESFNISVSAAIILYDISQKLRKQPDLNWQLTEEEKNAVKLQWLRNSIKKSSLLEQRYMEEQERPEN